MSDEQKKLLPLSGIRVLDFTNNIAGPCTGMLLAERGAEVIHIEKPVLGDDNRGFAPFVDGMSFSYLWTNKGKKSIVLNLKDPRAKRVVYEMLKDADVLLESNRPGAMDRLGFGYKEVHKLNPKLIYCSISAFGQTGQLSSRPGYDIIAQAYSGILDQTGEPDGQPVKSGFAIGDFVGAINAFGSISLALFQRSQTGTGQHIDIALARGLMWMNQYFDYSITGQIRNRMGNHDSKLSPYGIFSNPTGSSVVIGAVNASTWARLCAAMGKEGLISDPRYDSNGARVIHQKEVKKIIEDWLAALGNIDVACEKLAEQGVPHCKVMPYYELATEQHVVENGWIRKTPVPNSVHSTDVFLGLTGLATFSDMDILVQRAADLGEHNMEVLQKYGLSAQEIDAMEKEWASSD